MSTRTHRLLIPLAVTFLVLLALFAFARPVQAEGEEPPPPESTEIVAAEEAAPDATEVAPTPEVADPPPADETPVDEPPVDGALPAETILPEVVDALAETGTLLVDEFGNPIPAGSEAMTEALLDGDPWYRVGGVTYNYTTVDCNPYLAGNQGCANPISAALSDINIRNLTLDDGTLHVEAGTYTESFAINGALAGLNRLYALVGASSETVTLNGTITIQNMPYGFTLSGFTVNATAAGQAILFTNNTGTITVSDVTVKDTGGAGRNGIVVNSHNGQVSFNNVRANESAGMGAAITNTLSTYAGVYIYQSSFDKNNGAYGLQIYTNGPVTLTAVSASAQLAGGGAFISGTNGYSLSITDSIMINNSGWGLSTHADHRGYISITNTLFNDNSLGGMWLRTQGDIYLYNNLANSSNGATHPGAILDTCKLSGGVCTATGGGNISIYSSSFDGNGGIGLDITSKGNVYMDSVTAITNSGAGASINIPNTYAVVSISRASFYSNTGGDGLRVTSGGSITLNGIDAYSNNFAGARGAYLDNTLGAGWIYIYDTYTHNYFNYNNNSGLSIKTKGSALLYGVDAIGNGYIGLNMDLTGGSGYASVTRGTYANNVLYGINVSAKGSITLDSVDASNNNAANGYYGAYLDNSAGTGSVSVFGSYSPSKFGYNSNTGLYINTSGAVTISNVQATHNTNFSGGLGSFISATGSASYVSIYNSQFSYNDTGGVNITTTGFVSWFTGEALFNTGTGISISNTGAAHDYTYVYLYDINDGYNSNNGIVVSSRAAITLANVLSYSNGGMGLVLDNTASSTFQGISILGYLPYMMAFTYNHTYAMLIQSDGNITVTNADCYGTIGAAVAGNFTNNTGNGYVSITNASFDNSSLHGLRVTSKGAIMLYNVTAANPGAGGYSAQLDNSTAPNDYAYVTVGLGTFSGSKIDGLRIFSRGSVTLTDVNASNATGGNGLYIDNAFSTAFMPVSVTNTLTGFGYFNQNSLRGIYILSDGSVTLGNVLATQNGLANVEINNSSGSGYVYAYNGTFSSSSGGAGLRVTANGSVTLYSIFAESNLGGVGLEVNNNFGTLANPVFLSGGLFRNNHGSGVSIASRGAVTIYNIDSNDNNFAAGYDGIYIDNTPSTVNSMVAIYNTIYSDIAYFNNNSGQGLDILSKGIIILSSVYAQLNTLTNAQLTNTSGAGYVSVTGGNFGPSDPGGNGDGLNIDAKGWVYLYSVDAGSNDGKGIVVVNTASTLGEGVLYTYGKTTSNKNTGIEIDSKGPITITYVESQYNGNSAMEYGMLLNTSTGTNAAITVAGLSYPSWTPVFNNYDSNLSITSSGAVYLSYLSAFTTTQPGSRAASIAALGYVSIMSCDFSNSKDDGLNVITSNGIYIYNITSNNNLGDGAYLVSATTNAFVSVYKAALNSNAGYGLYISADSTSPITIASIDASRNTTATGYGAYIDNDGGTGSMGVTVLNTYGSNTFNYNNQNGLYITTLGPITLYNVTALGNVGYGANLVTTGTYAYVSIFTGSFNGTAGGTGLRVSTPSWIAAYYLSASSNALHGADLTSTGANQSVSVYSGSYTYNSSNGLNINARGNITVSGITTSSNSGNGMSLVNTLGTGSVSVLNSYGVNTANFNTLDGVAISTNGAVTIYSLTANRNNQRGLSVVNNTGTAPVLFYYGNFYQNNREAVHITTNAYATLGYIYAAANGFSGGSYSGLVLNTTNHNAVIYYSTFIGNARHGIDAQIGAAQTLTMYGTRYYGNSLGAGLSVANINCTGTKVIYP